MKQNIYKTLLTALLIVPTFFAQGSATNEFTNLKSALSEKTITTFVVLRMPDDIEFRSSLTPQRLREFGPPLRKYKLEMNDSRATLLANWVKQAKFTPRKYSPDCRWGLLFMDRNGKEVASLFTDRFGLAGNVDGHDLDFPNGLLLDTVRSLVAPQVR